MREQQLTQETQGGFDDSRLTTRSNSSAIEY